MFQVIVKIIISLLVVTIGYFIIKKIWTNNIDIVKWFEKPSDIIPVKDKEENQSELTEILQEEKNKLAYLNK